jgi:threonine synthase
MHDTLPGGPACFVTHLECSATGERHEANVLHGLSRAGKPLLVRYDLARLRQAVDRHALAGRPPDMCVRRQD